MDINLSMLLDRPPHVQGRLCNVPSLSDADFKQTDGSKSTETVNRTLSEANVFAINIAQLAQIGMHSSFYSGLGSSLMHTVDRFFTLKFEEDGDSQDICLDQISLWSSSLPLELRAVSTNSSKWTILTQILYQYVDNISALTRLSILIVKGIPPYFAPEQP